MITDKNNLNGFKEHIKTLALSSVAWFLLQTTKVLSAKIKIKDNTLY